MTEPAIVTVKELAFLLDCSPTRIRKLAAEGTVKKLAHDRYDRDASITGMVKRLRDLVERRGAVDPANQQANARLRTAKTQLLEARFRREAGQLVDAAEARVAWGQIVRGTTMMITGLAPKIAAALPTLTVTDQETNRQLISDGLEDLALDRGYNIGHSVVDADDDELPPAA